jgi:hypothetical protein
VAPEALWEKEEAETLFLTNEHISVVDTLFLGQTVEICRGSRSTLGERRGRDFVFDE